MGRMSGTVPRAGRTLTRGLLFLVLAGFPAAVLLGNALHILLVDTFRVVAILHWSVSLAIVTLPSLLLAVVFIGSLRTLPRYPKGYCSQCGYDLTGNITGRCPECGAVH